jgi:fermentation-respiration switch protein FrsA (DUF1100 family)
MSALKWLLGALVVFGCFVLVMYLAQRSLMYLPERQRVSPAAAGFPGATEIVLNTADGEKVIAWHVPPHEDKPVILYFHGNGGSLRYRAQRFKELTADGTGLLALSYRGYGGSTGHPTEAGLLADAKALYAFARERYSAERLVLWGESLGSGVAVALAAEQPVGRIVLEAPFTSAADVASTVYWFMPIRLLMKDQFRSDERIAKVQAPVLILHGERDYVVPFAQGQRLFTLANEPKRFVPMRRGGHNDLDEHGAQDAVRAFLNEQR